MGHPPKKSGRAISKDETAEELGSSWMQFAVHCMIGGLVAMLIWLFPGFSLVDYLERKGADFATQTIANNEAVQGNKRVVVVDLGPADILDYHKTEKFLNVAALTKAIAEIRTYHPAAILLDFVIADDDKTNPAFNDLKKALSDATDGIPIVVLERTRAPDVANASVRRNFTLIKSWFDEERPLHLTAAVPDLRVDSDGTVRRMAPYACVKPPSAPWVKVPTLAFAFSQGPSFDFSACPDRNKWSATEHEALIAYKTGPEIIDRSDFDVADQCALCRPINFIRAQPCLTEPRRNCGQSGLEGAFVLIGQSAGTDMFVTPLGLMPGVLVQANALWTSINPAEGVYAAGVKSFMVESGFIIIFATLMTFADWLATRVTRYGTLVEHTFRVIAVLAVGVGYLVFWQWFAFHVLIQFTGLELAVGTFVPFLAMTLETAMRLGPSIEGLAAIGLKGVIRKSSAIWRARTTAGSVLAIVLGASAAHAGAASACSRPEAPHLMIVAGSPDEVFVLRADEPWVRHAVGDRRDYPLNPFDTVEIRQESVAAMIFQDCSQKRIEGPDVSYLVPPAASRQAFWEALLIRPTETTMQAGNAVLTRGLSHLGRAAALPVKANAVMQVKQVVPGEDISVPLSGGLRGLPALAAEQAVLVKARSGLAYAWLGGQPPYAVTVSGGDAPRTLQAGIPFIWLPDWAMRGDDAWIEVRDATGATLRAHLKSAAAAPPSDDPMALFESGGASWRLEAFRDLRAVAATDVTSAQAVAAIRLSGTE